MKAFAFAFLISLSAPAFAKFDLPPSPQEEAAACAKQEAMAEREAYATANMIAKQKKTTLLSLGRGHLADSCGSGYITMNFADGMVCKPLVTMQKTIERSGKVTIRAVTLGLPNCAY